MTNERYEELMRPVHERFAIRSVVPECVERKPVVSGDIGPGDARAVVTRAHDEDTTRLRDELLARIYVHSHDFFERLIIDVLLRMGYGSRRRDLARCLGKSHDGGVDGIISQDELGLDVIYVQAKRLRPGSAVSISQVRDFAGSLEARRATKGVFVTTSQFPASANEFVKAVSRRIVLVSGHQLADIMVRHNIGVRVKETYQFKELEPTYFKSVAENRDLNPSAGK